MLHTQPNTLGRNRLNFVRSFFLAFAPLLFAILISSQESSLVSVADTTFYPTGEYYALVIGIDSYPETLPTLETAVHDAQAIEGILHDQYGFQVKHLLNAQANRSAILDALDSYRDTVHENDNLLIYFAGHGYYDHPADRAYWLPADADSSKSSNKISADDLTAAVRALPARHVLIISDSCYSGDLTREVTLSSSQSTGSPDFIRRMLGSRSRTLMTSGGDEPVSDSGPDGHSIFAYAVIQSLEQNQIPMLAASDLFYASVRQRVAGSSDQLPRYAIIRNSNHEEGDFVFIRKNMLATAPPSDEPASAAPTRSAALVQSMAASLTQAAPASSTLVSDQDKAAIQKIVNSYAEIFVKRKARSLKEIWPTVSTGRINAIQSVIDGSKNLTILLIPQKWELHGTGILVTCQQTESFERNGRQTSQNSAISFYVVKNQGTWIISDMLASSD